MIRASTAAVGLLFAALVVGCSGPSDASFGLPTKSGPTISARASQRPATHRPRPGRPLFPTVRWDQVLRGPLPPGCSTFGATSLDVNAPGVAYASGPSVSCTGATHYWVRALIKVAIVTSGADPTYLTPVDPSPAAVDRAAAQRTELTACSPGELLEPVASFVFLWPDGHLVRYKLIGNSARCG